MAVYKIFPSKDATIYSISPLSNSGLDEIIETSLNPEGDLLNNSALFAVFYAIWFYITKKLANTINSDVNGVIYY